MVKGRMNRLGVVLVLLVVLGGATWVTVDTIQNLVERRRHGDVA
jgi:hypothetical protein